MTFWTSTGGSALSPKRKDLFLVRMDNLFGNELVWWAKTVEKPSIQFEGNSGPQAGSFIMGAGYMGQQIGYINPGALQAFSPISIVMVDPNGNSRSQVAERIMSYMQQNKKLKPYYGLQNATRDLGVVQIEQLAHPSFAQGEDLFLSSLQSSLRAGGPIGAEASLASVERWTLHQAHILGVDFGNLSYADGNFVEISLSIGYTGFNVEMGAEGNTTTYSFGNTPQEPVLGSILQEATQEALETLGSIDFTQIP